MKCKWPDCKHEARAKSPFCSGTCKKRYHRASGTDVPVEVGQKQVGQADCVPVVEGGRMMQVGLDHYRTCPDQYAKRVHPELLNWGLWMNRTELEQAGLKANRVSIPGDWDYEGAAIFIPGLPLSAHVLAAPYPAAAPVPEQDQSEAKVG